MSDQDHTSPTLSEIGHLFLSSVRQRHTDGAPMPRRTPPGATAARQPVMVAVPIREADQAAPAESVTKESPTIDAESTKFPPVTALLSAHLNGRQRERVWAYARHLASHGQRIGLVELGAAEFRVTCFEQLAPEARDAADGLIDESPAEESFDARVVAEALEEMSWDVDRWLLLMPAGVRGWEAKCLLRDVGHWALLGTCDHDGVVSCYRTLKGLNPGGEDWPRPRLTLALLECADEGEADGVHRKLSGVSQQFLGLPLEAEPPVRDADDVAEHPVMFCRLPRPTTASEKNTVGAHWQVVADFVAKAKAGRRSEEVVETTIEIPQIESKPMLEPKPAAVVVNEPIELAEAPAATRVASAAPATPAMRWTGGDLTAPVVSEVIELPDAAGGSTGILSAVLKSEASALLECPITPPACPQAKLAVGRDRRLVLLAVGHQGLADLRAIGKAYQWLYENRSLIAMALPQAAIDANAAPQLRLFVDHADLNAAALQPMLQAGAVTVQAYRRLRWGGRNGLLLEAA